MVAGFVYAQLRNEDPADAARTASAFSVAAVTQFGPRLPSPNRVLGYRTQVRIENAS
jgi:sugar/nucleoside kinase (ribokinase family)